MEKKRCSDCKKWDYHKGNFGFCRAKAPRPTIVRGAVHDEYTLVWPSTGRDDWCEDFEAIRDLKVAK
jgi:hypothetical protein